MANPQLSDQEWATLFAGLGDLPSQVPGAAPAVATSPQPQASVPMQTPFGTNIRVPVQTKLPSGLSPKAQSVYNPLLSQLTALGLPVKITSGYRDPAYNKRVGGASGSQHLGGNALDFSLSGLTEPQKQAFIKTVQSNPAIGGFGYYPKSDSIHIDVRPNKTAWGSTYGKESVGAGWPDWMTQSTRNWLGGRAPEGSGPTAAATPASVPVPPTPKTVAQLQASAPSTVTPAGPAPSMAQPPLPQAQPSSPPSVFTGTPSGPPVKPAEWPNPAQPAKAGDLFGNITKALGGFASMFEKPPAPAPVPVAPMLDMPFPGAPAGPTALDIFQDPGRLNTMLDPKGLFLGLR